MRRQSDHSIKTREAHVRQLFVTTRIDGMCTVVHGAMAMRDFSRVCDEPAFRISNGQNLAVAGSSQTRQNSLIAMEP